MNSSSPFKNSRPPMLVSDVVKPSIDLRWRAIKITVIVLLLSLATGAGGMYLWLDDLGVFSITTDRFRELQNYTYRDNSLVYDRNGNRIGEFFEKYHIFVPYKNLPQHFVDALVAIEDKNFFEHNGVDPSAMVRATIARIKSGKFKQGASTITQQVVRHFYLTKEKTLERKIQEIALAIAAEKSLSKEKILELYVNNMFLGNGAYGIGAAARRYFGKDAQDLSPEESALLAGLFQSPSRYNPTKYADRAKKRQLQVIESMLRTNKLQADQALKLKGAPIQYKEYKYINNSSAPWFVDYVQEFITKIGDAKITNAKQSGLRIHTSLDLNMQRLAEKAIKSHENHLNDLRNRTGRIKDNPKGELRYDAIEAAMLVSDPKTGDILAMVGGRDYSKSQFNRTAKALRSPGSAFKPVVYTEALAQGYKWSDLIFVSPINVENYRPKNIKEDYLTETTMLRAFYRSMNTPTVEIASKLGIQPIIERAKSLGMRSPIKEELGSALGGSEVTMLDLARAYGTYAAGGVLTELSPITKITSADGQTIWEQPKISSRQKRVLNSQLAYLMTQGMRAVLSVGTGHSSADLAGSAAGKTGTSNNSADNWFCGYTPDLVSIVWVGTDERTPIMANVTGGAIALPIWDQFIRSSQALRHPRDFDRPDGVVEASVHPLYGHLVKGGTKMFFLSNKLPEETESALEKIENTGGGGYRNVFRH